jgi:FkbM family methyltransferase
LISRKEPVFFDIGANVGNYTAKLAAVFPGALIHAFEPHPVNYRKLREVAAPGIKAHHIALGKSGGETELYDRADTDGSTHASIYKEVISEIHKAEIRSYRVAVDTLDTIAEKEKIRFIDFMKIDTEGNELDVLGGAKRLLGERAIGCIHFEFNEMHMISRAYFRDFRKVLGDYSLYRLLPRGLLPLDDTPVLTEIFAYQNIIAIPAGSEAASRTS